MPGVVVGMSRAEQRRSEVALRWAWTEAALRGLSLEMTHVWTEPLNVTVDVDPDMMPGSGVAITAHALPGSVATALLADRPEMLVLGRRPNIRHCSRLTRTCTHHAACPVVVVPDAVRNAGGPVVVGVCGTQASLAALRWAASEARLRRQELVVAYAWQLHPSTARDVLQPVRAEPRQRAAALDRVHSWLFGVLGSANVKVRLSHGAPLDGLLHAASDASLIVLGRTMCKGVRRILHGPIDNQLYGLAPCPVAVIPSDPDCSHVPGNRDQGAW
jgi:nucleotide-binding universal stress UspA family protein